MKHYCSVALLVAITFWSCNSGSKHPVKIITKADTIKMGDSAKPGDMNIMIPGTFCYSTITGKDSVTLKTEIFPNVVTGNLSYKLFEKDSNRGTIDGVFKGDTLVADYTFMSEGKSSVRQVVFIIRDNVATEGYGDMEEKDGKMIFKSMDKLDFRKGLKLQKVDCPIE